MKVEGMLPSLGVGVDDASYFSHITQSWVGGDDEFSFLSGSEDKED